MMQQVVDAAGALIDDHCGASHATADRFVMRLAIYFRFWHMLSLSRPVQLPLTLKTVVQPYFCSARLYLPRPNNLSYGKCSTYMACLCCDARLFLCRSQSSLMDDAS